MRCDARALAAFCLAIAVTAGAAGIAPARAQNALDLSAIDALVTRLMAMYDVPGAAVALIQNGKIVSAKGYGYRDLALRAPVTERTLFNIGSVTKSFTALGIAQLVDQGELDLDVPVIKYVPELRLADPQATKSVTLRQLLSHTSGLPRADDWIVHVPATRTQVIRDLAKIPVTAKPGDRFQYCNQNFVLAAYVVERVTGQSWEEYTRSHVFAPLGMARASLDIDRIETIPDFARPYQPDVWLGESPVPATNNAFRALRALGPAGGINANVTEMGQYAQFQLGDGSYRGAQVVSARMLDEMHRGQVTLGRLLLIERVKYGLGWFTEEYRGVDIVEHGGDSPGFTANITLVPAAGAGVVVLTNADGANLFIEALRLSLVEALLRLTPRHDLAKEINTQLHVDPGRYAALVDAARAYKVSPPELARWTGDYAGPFGKARIAAARDRLLLRGSSARLSEQDLIPLGPDKYIVNHTRGSVVSFKTDANGVVTLYQGATPIANRVGARAHDGIYENRRGGFQVMAPAGMRLEQEGGILILRSADPQVTIIAALLADGGSDLDAATDRFVERSLPRYIQRVLERRDLGSRPGRQTIYALPEGQLLVVVSMREDGRASFTAVFGRPNAIHELTPALNFIVGTFRLS